MNSILLSVVTAMLLGSGATLGAAWDEISSPFQTGGPGDDQLEYVQDVLERAGLPEVPEAPAPDVPEGPEVPQPKPDPEPEPEPETPSDEPEPVTPVVVPSKCGEDFHMKDEGVFLDTPGFRHTWEFPVDCPVASIDVTLEVSGLIGPAYVDFDNRVSLFDGIDELVYYEHTTLNTGGGGTVMFEFHHNGPLAPFEEGVWDLILSTCFLMGEYELQIDVTY